MNWAEIIGLIGGGAGIVALIKAVIDIYYAKPNKAKLEVSVLNEIILRLDKELEIKAKEFGQYKESVNARVEEVKREILLEREENARFRRAIFQAWRCKLPENLEEDCPVIREYEKSYCESCKVHETK